MWRLLKPHQTWRDGEVTSPFELEVIDEDELGEHVTLPDVSGCRWGLQGLVYEAVVGGVASGMWGCSAWGWLACVR